MEISVVKYLRGIVTFVLEKDIYQNYLFEKSPERNKFRVKRHFFMKIVSSSFQYLIQKMFFVALEK